MAGGRRCGREVRIVGVVRVVLVVHVRPEPDGSGWWASVWFDESGYYTLRLVVVCVDGT